MSLFKSDSERELWIKLNAERQIEWEKGLTYFDKKTKTYKPAHQAIHHRSMEEALRIARNQCIADEKRGFLRFSFEQLLTWTREQLLEKQKADHKKWYNETFK